MGVGNTKWGMNQVSWRGAYTGKVQVVSSWGIVVGWRGQNKWKREMTLLQNAAVQKTLCAVKGSCGRKANAVSGARDCLVLAYVS